MLVLFREMMQLMKHVKTRTLSNLYPCRSLRFQLFSQYFHFDVELLDKGPDLTL